MPSRIVMICLDVFKHTNVRYENYTKKIPKTLGMKLGIFERLSVNKKRFEGKIKLNWKHVKILQFISETTIFSTNPVKNVNILSFLSSIVNINML